MLYGTSGSQGATSADEQIGSSGAPVRLYAVNMAVTGTDVIATLVLRNGTSASADVWIKEDSIVGTGSANRTVIYGEQGILFSKGCFFDGDDGFATLTFQYRVEN